MAIYHCNITVFSRSKGACSVAKAAYRSGSVLRDERTGKTHDYTRKTGIVHCEVLLPQNAPADYADRAALWNAVEHAEKAENAQVAREIEVALPIELTREQNISLVRQFTQEVFVSAGMCADVCIHDTGKGNPHAHIMLTMRPLNEDGTWGAKQRKVYTLDDNGNKIYDPIKRQYKCTTVKTVDWNDRTNAEYWRKEWAGYANTALRIAGVQTEDNILDHRSYARQGVEQIPTIHLGVAASQMERKGILTDKGNYNRGVADFNKQLKQVKARIVKLQGWLKTEKSETPTLLYDTFMAMLAHGKGDNLYARNHNLQLAAKVLNFLTEHKISDLAELKDAVGDLYSEQLAISNKAKPIQRRIDTLKEHLRQSENFKANRKVMATYDRLLDISKTASKSTGLFAKSKADKAHKDAQDFYDANRADIEIYRAAEKYLKGVLQSRYDPKKLPPIKAWEKELAEKQAEKQGLYVGYDALKEKVKSAETIRRYAERVMREVEPRERTRTLTHEETR
jgi:ATP-dependent exoDNAse (exonuclease V) alpha subunit